VSTVIFGAGVAITYSEIRNLALANKAEREEEGD
jgi:hypothetical protein